MLLIALAGCALRADVVTFTDSRQTQAQDCGNFGACQPFGLSLASLDPKLGVPESITWRFTDFLQYYGGINDMYLPTGLPFSWTTVGGDLIDLQFFGVGSLDLSQTHTYSGLTSGNRQISMGGWWSEITLTASGTIADPSTFVGDNGVSMGITPFLNASFPVDNNGVFAALISAQNNAGLVVTVTYASASVPEPRYSILVLCLAGAFLVLRLRSLAPTTGIG
jgi:hypothetical protein